MLLAGSLSFLASKAEAIENGSQVVILKMDDLRAHVSGTGVNQNWIDVMAKIRAANAVTNIGIVGMYINGDGTGTNVLGAANELANGGQEWIDWVKAEHATGDVEFWQHGWDHLPAYDEDASGDTSEFEASFARQQQHWNWAQAAATDVLGFDFRSFGAPGNKVNADTITIMDASPEINARYYGDDQSLISDAFNIERFGGSIESGSGGSFAPSWSKYQAAQAANDDKPYLAFQMHPEMWLDSEANLAVFQQILDDLVARNVTFMTAQQLVAHIKERREAIGPMTDFNTWGDFYYLFKEGGQVNKYTETLGVGLGGSRGLVVSTGGSGSSLVLQRTLPGNTPCFEIALHFQHVTPTTSGAQPLFIGVGPNDRYIPNLGNGGADDDNIVVSIDLNGSPPSTSQPRFRILSSTDGVRTQTTSGFLASPLIDGNWYRIRAVITHDINGYDIDAFLEESDDNGAIGNQLLTHSAADRDIPDLASADIYPLFGGQGAAYQRGIAALDNFYVSVLQPKGRNDGLLAYEGVANKHYRKNHSAYSGQNPEVRGFANSNWASGYTASVRPAGWNGASNADGTSRGIGYTAAGGETLIDGFSYRKLETARSVRELDTSAFTDYLDAGEIGLDGTTLYLSFLMEPRLSDADGSVSFELLSDGNSSGNRKFGIGVSRGLDDQFRIALDGNYSAPLDTLGDAVALQAEFFVVKIEFGAGTTAGNERVSIWRNPSWLSDESMSTPTAVISDVSDFSFDRIGLWNLSGAIAWFDEIRIGSNWSAVAPVNRDLTTHTYKSTTQRDLNLWLWKPANWSPADERPAILLVHGGGWSGGDPSKLETQARHFQDQGYVSIGVEYRLTSETDVTAEISTQDARSAMRYVKANADAFGINPDQIVALGGSAGGHLSLGLSMFSDPILNDPADDLSVDPAPFATVAFNPVTDTSAPDGFGTNSFASEANALLASPEDQVVANLPPLIMMHGDADSSVPVEDARDLRDLMIAAGNSVTYHEYAGAGHGFFNIENSTNQYNTDTLIQVDAFLEALGSEPFSGTAPEGVTQLVIDEEAESMIVSWTVPPSVSGIRIERSTNPYSGFSELATLSGAATSYEDRGLTAGTTYFYRVIAFNPLGETPSVVEDSGLSLTHLQDFRMDHFGTIENQGAAANDDDGEFDGVPNIAEFAFGGLPNVNDASQVLPSYAITTVENQKYLEITFRRREGSGSGSTESGYSIDGISYQVQTRDSLNSGDWATTAGKLEQIGETTSLGEGIEEVTVRLKPAIDSAANPQGFGRVRIELD